MPEHCQMRFPLTLCHEWVDRLPTLAVLQGILPLSVELADDTCSVLEPPKIVDTKHLARIERVTKLHLQLWHRKPYAIKNARKRDSPPFSDSPSAYGAITCALRYPRLPSQSERRRSHRPSCDTPLALNAESAIANPYENGARSRQSSTVRQNDVTCTPSTCSSAPAACGRNSRHPVLSGTEQPVLTRYRDPSRSFGTSRPHKSAAS